jgi:hypothetical protein
MSGVAERVRLAKGGDTSWFTSEFQKRLAFFPELKPLGSPWGYDVQSDIMSGSQRCAVTGKDADTALVFRQPDGPGAIVYVRRRRNTMELISHLYTLACFAHQDFVEYKFQSSEMLATWFLSAAHEVDEFVASTKKSAQPAAA